jgi:hypothetical protein
MIGEDNTLARLPHHRLMIGLIGIPVVAVFGRETSTPFTSSKTSH